MSIENGGEQPANDTALSNEDAALAPAAAAPAPADPGESEPELDAEGNHVTVDETEELEWDGKKWVLPKDAVSALKPNLLRQQDYTKKTMEVAEARKALDAEREGFQAHTATQKAVHAEAVKVAAIDEQLSVYANVDWATLYSSNPDLYQQHKINYDTLKDKRDAASRALESKQGELAQQMNRERGNQVAKAQAEITRLLPEWTPGGELDLKLSKYGTELGFSERDLAETALRNPQFVHQLNRLRLYDEAAKKQKTQATFRASQTAQPVTRVGGNSTGASTIRPTDPASDKLTTEEWFRREAARVAAKRKR